MTQAVQSPGRILVVDDQPANLRVVGALLSRSGYEVLTAGNAQDALALASQQPNIARVTVRVNPTFVGDPSTANFSIAAENISQNVLDLTFPSGCQLLPYVLERTTRRAVTPVGGGFACLTVITRATLRPGESIASNVLVKSGSSPNPAYVVLPPGDYVIYGRVEDQLFKAKSEELAFAVR